MGPHVFVNESPADIMVSLRRIVRSLRLADRESEAAYGLSAAALYVLQSLREGPVASVAELADRTLTDPSSVSTVVDRLVLRKLVKRARSKADARRFELSLTAAGERALAGAPRAMQFDLIAKLHALAPDRRTQIAHALTELVELMGAGSVPARMLFEDESSRRG